MVAVVVGLLVLGLVLAGAYFAVVRILDSIDNGGTGDVTTASGTVRLPATAQRAVVAITSEVTKDTKVAVNARPTKGGKGLDARVAGPDREGQFTVVLARPAPRGGAVVDWQVSGLAGGASSETDWTTEWVVVLIIMVISLLAALAAYWMAVWRRQAGSDGQIDVGPELASFLKVAALLMIGALALIAVMLATEETSLSALFGLFGTIAGYLAGNRSETSGTQGRGGRGQRQRTGGHGNEPDDEGTSEGEQREQFRMQVPEKRSLL